MYQIAAHWEKSRVIIFYTLQSVKFRHSQNNFFAPLDAQAVRLGAGQVISYNLSVHHQRQLKEPGAFWVQAHGLISDFSVQFVRSSHFLYLRIFAVGVNPIVLDVVPLAIAIKVNQLHKVASAYICFVVRRIKGTNKGRSVVLPLHKFQFSAVVYFKNKLVHIYTPH
jgi:hypothetical protein